MTNRVGCTPGSPLGDEEGASGGIGLQLNAAINSLAWNQVSVIFVMIFVTVLASEWISARVRHAII